MPNEKWTCGDERTSPLDQVFQPGLGGKEEREREQTERDREREGFRERGSTFSLSFPTIGPASSGEARSKVALHGKDYTWVPGLESLDKLRKGRGFSPTWFTFCLRVM